MQFLKKLYFSTIGQKIIMAVTGILMCLFLVFHLLGNTLLFVGKKEFNDYSNFLGSLGGGLYVVELGLVLVLFLHIWSATRLTLQNRKAKGHYAVKKVRNSSTLMSSYMLHSGAVIAIFLVLHIVSFKFGEWNNVDVNSQKTLYDLVVTSFANPWYAGFYLISMIFLGFHLHHSFKSAFITLGLVRYSAISFYSKLSFLFSVLMSVGFSSFPIYFYLLSIL